MLLTEIDPNCTVFVGVERLHVSRSFALHCWFRLHGMCVRWITMQSTLRFPGFRMICNLLLNPALRTLAGLEIASFNLKLLDIGVQPLLVVCVCHSQ